MQNKNGIEHFDLDKHKRTPWARGHLGQSLRGIAEIKTQEQDCQHREAYPLWGPLVGEPDDAQTEGQQQRA